VVQREAEHRQSAPDIEFELGDSIGGGGHEVILTSKDRDLHSVTVSWLQGIDSVTDRTVIGLTDRPAAAPIGTMKPSITVHSLQAGSVTTLGLWTRVNHPIAGALIRLSCRVVIKPSRLRRRRTWVLIRDVSAPTHTLRRVVSYDDGLVAPSQVTATPAAPEWTP
jgi:hypothetical protein